MSAEIIKGKIIIYPTKIMIEGYYERNPSIESPLSVYDEVTHSYSFQAFIKDEENNTITIPSGYSVNYLSKMYPTYELIDKKRDIDKKLQKYKSKNKITMKYDFKNDLQKEANAFLNIGLKYKTMQRFLCMQTGGGKTYNTVRYIVDNKERPIIFVDQDSLGQQWIDRIQEYTDTNENEIYYISGRSSIDKLMKMNKEDILKIKFFICCYRTLMNAYEKEEDKNIINELFEKIQVTMKVYDEAHIEFRSIFRIDMNSNLRTFYITATPKRSAPNEDKVYQRMFEHIDKFFSPTENYHNIVLYKWNSHPSLKQEFDCSNKYGFSTPNYCKYILKEKYEEFKNLLIFLIFNYGLKNRRKRKLAILFGTNELLERFYTDLYKYIFDKKYKLEVGIFNGKVPKDKRLEILEKSDIILTTDASFSKAMDVKGLQILINTVPFSSDAKLTQVIGRLRFINTKEVFFFDVNDIGFEGVRRQLYIKTNNVYKKKAKNLFIKTHKEEPVI